MAFASAGKVFRFIAVDDASSFRLTVIPLFEPPFSIAQCRSSNRWLYCPLVYKCALSLSLSPRCYDDDDDATPRGEMRKRIGFALECRLLTYNRGREYCEGILKGGRGGARAKERNVRAFSI